MIIIGGSKGAKRSHAPPPKNARKRHKVDIFLDITRKNLLFIQVWSLLLVRPKASEIRNWGTSLKFGPFQSPLSGSAVDDLPNFRRFVLYKNRCSPKDEVKTGRHVIRHVECFKNTPSLFVTLPLGLIIPGLVSRDPGIVEIPNPGIGSVRDFGIPLCCYTQKRC